MDYTEISVDTKFHRHLIGKGGVNSKYSLTVKSMVYTNQYNNNWINILKSDFILIIHSQPHQRTAQGDCPHPP